MLLRHEEWRDLWGKAWARNHETRTTRNTPGLVANITRCLQRMEAAWEDAITIRQRDNRKISLTRGDDRKFKHDLSDAAREARLRMINGKDLREDAAKGIDKTASLHLLRSKQLTQWQRGQLRAMHMNGVWTCDALHKAEDWEGNRAADEQAKKGAKNSEPPQQMMSECIRRRHMIQNAQMAAIHILEWRRRRSETGASQTAVSVRENGSDG